MLDSVINELEHCFTSLNNLAGKAGQSLTENDWLMSVRSRMGIPGGTCEFDLPAYFAWQNSSFSRRQTDIARWSEPLTPLANAIYLLLKILRESGSAQKMIATGGQFQQNLPQGKPYQLLRMRIDSSLNLIPEISGNRLIVMIRLMRQDGEEHLHPSAEDAAFELTLCS